MSTSVDCSILWKIVGVQVSLAAGRRAVVAYGDPLCKAIFDHSLLEEFQVQRKIFSVLNKYLPLASVLKTIRWYLSHRPVLKMIIRWLPGVLSAYFIGRLLHIERSSLAAALAIDILFHEPRLQKKVSKACLKSPLVLWA